MRSWSGRVHPLRPIPGRRPSASSSVEPALGRRTPHRRAHRSRRAGPKASGSSSAARGRCASSDPPANKASSRRILLPPASPRCPLGLRRCRSRSLRRSGRPDGPHPGSDAGRRCEPCRRLAAGLDPASGSTVPHRSPHSRPTTGRRGHRRRPDAGAADAAARRRSGLRSGHGRGARRQAGRLPTRLARGRDRRRSHPRSLRRGHDGRRRSRDRQDGQRSGPGGSLAARPTDSASPWATCRRPDRRRRRRPISAARRDGSMPSLRPACRPDRPGRPGAARRDRYAARRRLAGRDRRGVERDGLRRGEAGGAWTLAGAVSLPSGATRVVLVGGLDP